AGPSLAARRAVPTSVLLVDDVVTTGATVSAAAAALRAGGAFEVHVLAAARTSPRRVHCDMAVRGSVGESRRQPQAKRPT
ncbi:MAG: hypothetical protein M3163_01930, partial [Actinomycetota bacterium]|nr:hypothetical protein [Actinomycetota bacterium]